MIKKKSKMLAQPSQLKFQAVSGTDGRYLILKTFIFFFEIRHSYFLKLPVVLFLEMASMITLIDFTAIIMQLTI